MGELKNISLDEISVSKNNPRKHADEQKLKDLVASIKEKGVIEPIIVRKAGKGYEVVCGERRVKAAKLADLKEIPAVVRELDDKQALEFQVIENLQREDVHPLEEAEGYEQLIKKHGYKTVDDIAMKVGKSKAYIYGRMKLCDLIPENRKHFYDGKFSPSVALLVARVPAHLQKEAGKNVATGEQYGDGQPMSYRDAKEYIHGNFMLQLKEAQFDIKEKGLAGKVSCADCPKRTGNQKELFEDVNRADICTDPSCFEAKKQAFTQRAITKLKAEGKEVLPQDEAKKLFRYSSSDTPEHKYMTLDSHDWSWPQGITPRKMLKTSKDVKVIYAVQPFSGKLIEMVDKVDLPKILKNAGIKTDRPISSGGNIADNKKENRIIAAKRAFWIEKIQKHMDARVKDVLFLRMLLGDLGYDLEGLVITPKSEEDIVSDAPMDGDIEELYKLGEEKVKKMIARSVFIKPERNVEDDELEFLSTKLGFSMAKDYVITKEYLEACTKDELIKLGQEFSIPNILRVPGGKQELVEFVLKHAPKGKVPKELIGSKK